MVGNQTLNLTWDFAFLGTRGQIVKVLANHFRTRQLARSKNINNLHGVYYSKVTDNFCSSRAK